MAKTLEQLKAELLAEKQATLAKYRRMGLKPYYGLTGEIRDAQQDKLRAAFNAENAAIERRYKIEAGQA